MLMLISINILDMVSGLIEKDEVGRNLIIFGVDMNSSLYIDNKKKHISFLGKGPT